MHSLPRVIRENLFQPGCLSLRRELWSPLRNFLLDPHMFVPFMYVLYNTDIKQLEVPPIDQGAVQGHTPRHVVQPWHSTRSSGSNSQVENV